MTGTSIEVESTDLRCAVQTAAIGEPAAGTAGHAARIVMVELPLPWPAKIDQHPMLTGLVVPDDVRLLGVRRGDTRRIDEHHVVVFDHVMPFQAYAGREATCAPTELHATIGRLLDDPSTGSAVVDEDVLVCTHGTRDRCCAQFGTWLHDGIEERLGSDDAAIRLWKASHLGGHRFAPTFLHLPFGTVWGAVGPDLAVDILQRRCETGDLGPHFRGTMAFAPKAAQTAEAAVFVAEGWDWLDTARSTSVEADDDADDVTVVGGSRTRRVRVEDGGEVPVPACLLPLDQAKKSSRVLRVAAID